MTVYEAISAAYRLQAKWVGGKNGVSYDFAAIQHSIRSEMKFNRQRPERCTAGLKAETHGDAILLGKIRKMLADLPEPKPDQTEIV